MENPFEKIPDLTPKMLEQLQAYSNLLRGVNEKVNLLSRKDMENVEYRHVAFCAAIGAFFRPDKDARIADVGTGGGLPGIVMAILWPQARITMFDGVGKKIKMINEMLDELKLPNARAINSRIEEYKEPFDYATGRSVCALPLFFNFVKKRLTRGQRGNLKNGVIYFKGGELEQELISKNIKPDHEMDLMKFFDDAEYDGKKLVHFVTENVMRI